MTGLSYRENKSSFSLMENVSMDRRQISVYQASFRVLWISRLWRNGCSVLILNNYWIIVLIFGKDLIKFFKFNTVDFSSFFPYNIDIWAIDDRCSQWWTHPGFGTCLPGNDLKRISNIVSIDKCQTLCQKEHTCLSVDYHPLRQICYLNKADTSTIILNLQCGGYQYTELVNSKLPKSCGFKWEFLINLSISRPFC